MPARGTPSSSSSFGVVTFCQKSRAEPAGVGRDARMRGNQPLKQR